MISPRTQTLLRWSIAVVWLYQGLWNKCLVVHVLAWNDRHLRIMQKALGASLGSMALIGLATVETLFALAVLWRFRPLITAWSQILLLVTMNAAGIAFAARDIPDVGGMLTMNAMFCVAIWINSKFSLAHHE